MDTVLDLNNETAGVIDTVYESLVQVRNGRRGAGAGTIWHSEGLVVTNAHVAGRGPLKVELQDGRVLPAQIMAADPERDLAALRIEASRARSARSVAALLQPLALDIDFTRSARVISGCARGAGA